MNSYPASVGELATRQYAPLCVQVAADWSVEACWGDPARYGYPVLELGGDVREFVPALHGFAFDGDEDECALPFMGTPAGGSAHCYIQKHSAGYLITWFLAEHEHDETQKIQQIANEVRILNYRRTQLVGQLEQAQEMLLRQEQELKLANRQQARFISGLSRDYRMPLKKILLGGCVCAGLIWLAVVVGMP